MSTSKNSGIDSDLVFILSFIPIVGIFSFFLLKKVDSKLLQKALFAAITGFVAGLLLWFFVKYSVTG